MKSYVSSYKRDDRISRFHANIGATDATVILHEISHEVYLRFINKVPKSGEYVTKMNRVLSQSCIRCIDFSVDFGTVPALFLFHLIDCNVGALFDCS